MVVMSVVVVVEVVMVAVVVVTAVVTVVVAAVVRATRSWAEGRLRDVLINQGNFLETPSRGRRKRNVLTV